MKGGGGQAVMKIIKHAREASTGSAAASGQLLGIDSQGTLNVSDVVPLPAGSLSGSGGEGEDRGSKSGSPVPLPPFFQEMLMSG